MQASMLVGVMGHKHWFAGQSDGSLCRVPLPVSH